MYATVVHVVSCLYSNILDSPYLVCSMSAVNQIEKYQKLKVFCCQAVSVSVLVLIMSAYTLLGIILFE